MNWQLGQVLNLGLVSWALVTATPFGACGFLSNRVKGKKEHGRGISLPRPDLEMDSPRIHPQELEFIESRHHPSLRESGNTQTEVVLVKKKRMGVG